MGGSGPPGAAITRSLDARGAVLTGLAGLALLAAYMSVVYDPFPIGGPDLLMATGDGPAPPSAIGRPILADDIFVDGDASITWTTESLGAGGAPCRCSTRRCPSA